ncbi:hypothetical protein TWF594_006348 [Orbilia oligospora]|nr:hypothetical protein TWF594_006348 [Orbilia oligospora]KAF3268508.1 hypothetical protein TWF128_006909 [Orbilia oligospora]
MNDTEYEGINSIAQDGRSDPEKFGHAQDQNEACRSRSSSAKPVTPVPNLQFLHASIYATAHSDDMVPVNELCRDSVCTSV